MNLSFKVYDLHLKHRFTVSGFSRNTSPTVLTEIKYDGIVGYGEASTPPYLGESQESVYKFLKKVNLKNFNDPFRFVDILEYIDAIENGNYAAKASIDIALHDLIGKIINKPLYKLWGLSPGKTPMTSFTIGIDNAEIVREKTKKANHFKVLKVKLNGKKDKQMINTIRSVTNVPLYVDVNQGWKDKHQALEMIYWLNERGIKFVEQPIHKTQIEDIAWLTENSPIPVIADEAVQRLPDVLKIKDIYSGINIKLMKSTGLHEAHKMITLAKALDMKILLGCMVETSCAVSAAAQLSPLVDWADLDGNLLISNDVFKGVKIIDGKITLNDLPGIGITKII